MQVAELLEDLRNGEQQARLAELSGWPRPELLPVSGSGLVDLSAERLTDYQRNLLEETDLPESDAEWRRRLILLGFMMPTREGQKVCTLAGILLFGRAPRRSLPQAGIRWLAFGGDSKDHQALDDALLDGPLVALCRGSAEEAFESLEPGLIEQVIERMTPLISSESEQVDDGLRRRRIWHYSLEAVREAILNALVHRDWTRLPVVEIVSYGDRLEITSPGALSNSMTLEKMLAGQRSRRNTLLVDVMRDYGYVEPREMGVRRKIVPLIRSATRREAQFEATEDYVRVILPRAHDKRDA